MEPWLLCTWGQARASRRGHTWPVPPREAEFPVGVEGPDPSSPLPCPSFQRAAIWVSRCPWPILPSGFSGNLIMTDSSLVFHGIFSLDLGQGAV